MKFQELVKGVIDLEAPIWIISGQSSIPDTVLAIISEVTDNSIVTSGSQLEFETSNLFIMIGSVLFSLENCRVSDAPHGQYRLEFDSAVQIYPKVASGFQPPKPVPLSSPSVGTLINSAVMDAKPTNAVSQHIDRSQHV